jgi:hypothetical protein
MHLTLDKGKLSIYYCVQFIYLNARDDMFLIQRYFIQFCLLFSQHKNVFQNDMKTQESNRLTAIYLSFYHAKSISVRIEVKITKIPCVHIY